MSIDWSQGRFAVGLLVAGNLATILSSVESSRSLIVSVGGISALRFVLLAFALLILLGYLGLFGWLVRRFLIGGRGARSYSWGIFGMIGIPALLLANYQVLHAESDPFSIMSSRSQAWSQELFDYQATDGGIYPVPTDMQIASQPWTTAQVIKGLLAATPAAADRQRILRALDFLEKSRQPSGWLLHDGLDYTVTEITAWVTLAHLEILRSGVLKSSEDATVRRRVLRDLTLLRDLQSLSGGWSPVAGAESGSERTYSSLVALWAMVEASTVMDSTLDGADLDLRPHIIRGINWLMRTYSPDHGWRPNPQRMDDRYYQALTAHVLFVLKLSEPLVRSLVTRPNYLQAKRDLLAKVDPTALLLVNDRLRSADALIKLTQPPGSAVMIEESTYLAYPWSVLAFFELSKDVGLSDQERLKAMKLLRVGLLQFADHVKGIGIDGNYELAENLFCIGYLTHDPEARLAIATESSVLDLLAAVARDLPWKQRPTPYFVYVVTVIALFMLFLALRLHVWRVTAPKLEMPRATGAEVTVILPVRNEEENVSGIVGSLLQQDTRPRVLVVNDASTDRTREIVERLAMETDRLKLLDCPELPAMWKGKVHALQVGFEATPSPWILLTDADTRHQSQLLNRALATAELRGLDLLSIAGSQETQSFGENLLTPMVFGVLDSLLGDWHKVASGESEVANGQFILLRREALECIGGFHSIRNQALDDVALVRRVRSKDMKAGFFRVPRLLRIRMYQGLKQTFLGWRRNLGAIFAGNRGAVGYLSALALAPVLLMLWGFGTGDWGAVAVLWAAGSLSSMLMRYGSGHPPLVGLVYPLDALTFWFCMLLGIRDASRGRLAAWKGREILLDKTTTQT